MINSNNMEVYSSYFPISDLTNCKKLEIQEIFWTDLVGMAVTKYSEFNFSDTVLGYNESFRIKSRPVAFQYNER